jgi:RHS repeat-associated protein
MVLDHLDYDGWGNATETNSGNGDRYKWTGREYDATVGLQYNRARYYDPRVGRWTSQDPLGFGAGDSNLYRYVTNRPLILNDPTGLQGAGNGAFPGPEKEEKSKQLQEFEKRLQALVEHVKELIDTEGSSKSITFLGYGGFKSKAGRPPSRQEYKLDQALTGTLTPLLQLAYENYYEHVMDMSRFSFDPSHDWREVARQEVADAIFRGNLVEGTINSTLWGLNAGADYLALYGINLKQKGIDPFVTITKALASRFKEEAPWAYSIGVGFLSGAALGGVGAWQYHLRKSHSSLVPSWFAFMDSSRLKLGNREVHRLPFAPPSIPLSLGEKIDFSFGLDRLSHLAFFSPKLSVRPSRTLVGGEIKLSAGLGYGEGIEPDPPSPGMGGVQLEVGVNIWPNDPKGSSWTGHLTISRSGVYGLDVRPYTLEIGFTGQVNEGGKAAVQPGLTIGLHF